VEEHDMKGTNVEAFGNENICHPEDGSEIFARNFGSFYGGLRLT
jgi:hypothetical protein